MIMNENDKKARKKLYIVVSQCFAVAYALYCLVLSPLYFWLDSNVAYANTVLPAIMHYLGIAAELTAISVFYGVMIYGIRRFGARNFGGCTVIYAVATACKYTVNIVMTWITFYGVIPATWIWDVANVVFYTALEMIQLWIITAIVKHILKREEDREDASSSALIYDSSNVFMKCALVCGIVTVVAKLVGRVSNDVWSMIVSGLPQKPITVVLMLLSYLSCVILGVICYVITAAVASGAKNIVPRRSQN